MKYFKGTHGVPMTTFSRKKKRKPDPEQRAYKYSCSQGHIRIEKQALKNPLPNCPACEQDGRINPFKYISKYTIPRDQMKKSKFK
ncbi:hypothetical protein D1872_156580 [compost metagenome]